jgi:hypothetical protein
VGTRIVSFDGIVGEFKREGKGGTDPYGIDVRILIAETGKIFAVALID